MCAFERLGFIAGRRAGLGLGWCGEKLGESGKEGLLGWRRPLEDGAAWGGDRHGRRRRRIGRRWARRRHGHYERAGLTLRLRQRSCLNNTPWEIVAQRPCGAYTQFSYLVLGRKHYKLIVYMKINM